MSNEATDVRVDGSVDGDDGQTLVFSGTWNLEQVRDATAVLESANQRVRVSRSVSAMLVGLEMLKR